MKLEAKTRNQIKLQTITYTIVSSLSDSFEAWASPARIGNRDEPITKALGPNHSCWVAFDESIRYVVVHKVLRCTQKKWCQKAAQGQALAKNTWPVVCFDHWSFQSFGPLKVCAPIRPWPAPWRCVHWVLLASALWELATGVLVWLRWSVILSKINQEPKVGNASEVFVGQIKDKSRIFSVIRVGLVYYFKLVVNMLIVPFDRNTSCL